MDEKLIQNLWDRFDKSDAAELIYEADGARLELRKAEPRNMPKNETSGYDMAGSITADATADTTAAEKSGIYVKAPLPGTFYRASSPDDEPFVIIGKKVKQGEVVGIVESMKMMNEIAAPADGIVAEILAENGAVVGYDEALMRLV